MTKDSIRRGRQTALIIIAVILALSLTVTIRYVATIGAEKLPAQTIRFGLSIALCWWFFRGSNLARWILIVLLGLGGVVAFSFVKTGDSPNALAARITGVVMGCVYLTIANTLLYSKNIKHFLAYQRGEAPPSVRV